MRPQLQLYTAEPSRATLSMFAWLPLVVQGWNPMPGYALLLVFFQSISQASTTASATTAAVAFTRSAATQVRVRSRADARLASSLQLEMAKTAAAAVHNIRDRSLKRKKKKKEKKKEEKNSHRSRNMPTPRFFHPTSMAERNVVLKSSDNTPYTVTLKAMKKCNTLSKMLDGMAWIDLWRPMIVWCRSAACYSSCDPSHCFRPR